MSKETVVIKNAGASAIPVNGINLMPGETRPVTSGQYQRLSQIHPGLIIRADSGPAETTPETTPTKPPASKEQTEKTLAGMTFAIAGNLPDWNQSDAEDFITGHGGKVVDKVTAGIDALVAGENAGKKLEQAEKAGVLVVDKDGLLKIAGR